VEPVSSLRWHHRPKLRQPVLVAAFEGWNDAGDAASSAARWLADRYGAEMVATIDAEDFFDFTTTRPIDRGGRRRQARITWPDTELWAAATDAPATDLDGRRPRAAPAVAHLLQGRDRGRRRPRVLDGAHARRPPVRRAALRPTAVSGTADDPDLIEQLDLTPLELRGAHRHRRRPPRRVPGAGHPVGVAVGAVPTYVSGAPSPKATLALVERAPNLLGLRQPTTDLEIASAAYERQIDDWSRPTTTTPPPTWPASRKQPTTNPAPTTTSTTSTCWPRRTRPSWWKRSSASCAATDRRPAGD
jgi:hypothetical protein